MPRPAHYETPTVRIEKLIVGPFENNVFVVRCTGTGEAVIIDAANEHELLLQVSEATGVRRVLTTHGHWDHIQAVEAMRDAGIDVGIAPDDASMLPAYDFVLPDDEVITVGDLRLRTIHNPGHTPGSTSFLLEGHPDPVQRRHPLPRRRRQHVAPRRRLRADHRVDRPPPVHPPGRPPGAARPRARHHDRHRTTPSAGVGRPGLVSW